ncbi:MAG TPA: ATP-dependent RecD-like DNA helicase [Lachnospiraceae bacterium]|jgi:exodeoxyribonuclease V alpha subunit|nr:ATP-dependent RecD-like DNA helicase [Lachnospiraceae bacterium]
MQIKGYVEKIIYTNSDNGHTILDVSLTSDEIKRLQAECPDYADDIDEEMVCVGTLHLINAGEYVVFNGDFTVHQTYGLQFKVTSYEESRPEDMDSIERYLGSGAIKGVGPALAARIVRHFKMDTFRVIEENPEELSQVKGISNRMAMEIADQVAEKKGMRNAMLFLGKLGIGMNLAVKIYKEYGEKVYEIIENNPYKLADDMEGVGFKIADEIARNSGMELDSPFRIKSGILYALSAAVSAGHTYYPMDALIEEAGRLLGVFIAKPEEILTDLMIDRKVMVRYVDGIKAVYLYSVYHTELAIAHRLFALKFEDMPDEKAFDKDLHSIEKEENITLESMQREAVRASAGSGIVVITGGPGTGKTTTINTIIRYFERKGMDIMLAAPTGRAAKRMTEATGHEAQTIHRMLELSGILSDEISNASFERNETNPLETDVVIIDEMSMVDIFLMNSLLKAIADGTRLILVGDANQLPSVGPGNVLKDIIASGCFNTVRLAKIFRQEEAGDIVVNAHKINEGELFEIGPSSRDFPFIRRTDANAIINALVTLVKVKLPAYTDCSPNDVQVLTPTRKGSLGVERLNTVLQQYLNPPSNSKVEKEIGSIIFREGDKVMQIKNNYKIPWEVRGRNGIPIETGMGVFNGDMGIVDNINLYLSEMTVRFDEERYVTYTFKETDELEHAYAVTVHKSQGSEYPAVVLPLLDGPRMLMNRNILYTAVTRARKCICIVGSEQTFYNMISNENEQKRFSSLDIRIKEAAI